MAIRTGFARKYPEIHAQNEAVAKRLAERADSHKIVTDESAPVRSDVADTISGQNGKDEIAVQ